MWTPREKKRRESVSRTILTDIQNTESNSFKSSSSSSSSAPLLHCFLLPLIDQSLPPMELPEIVEFARNFSVMVRIQGPDPKGLKMRKHAFHHYQSGKTTLSASGLLLPESFHEFKHIQGSSTSSALVITVASIIEPFLSLQHRENSTVAIPELIKEAQIDVMIEGKRMKEVDNIIYEPDTGAPQWRRSKLLALVDVPLSSHSLQSLIEAPSGSPEHGSWEVGWSLASMNNGHQPFMDALQPQAERDIRTSMERKQSLSESSNPNRVAMSTTRIAFLAVSTKQSEDLPNLRISPPNKRGDLLLAMGSPFGILSPVHFYNSISVGSVANQYPSSSNTSSLLMADIRCLPGMEGGPVFGEHAQLIGILSRPLRQRVGGAEIQLVIPWVAIANAWSKKMLNEHKRAGELDYNKKQLDALQNTRLSKNLDYNGALNHDIQHADSYSPLTSPLDKAMSSIALITINDGAWASGVLLNNEGLILTNAHLLEPWRFGKTTVQGRRDQTTSISLPIISQELVSRWHEGCGGQRDRQMLPKMVKISGASVADDHAYKMGSIYKSYKRIRVRLDHTNPWIWGDARLVYVSKGPLDVALLQLESVPSQLSPIVPDFSSPSPGSKAHVIGHGLFGPRCDVLPSVCSGVVARVVKAQRSTHSNEPGLLETTRTSIPAMLETTAAVHPGGSGGAVVNSDGYMIGLVTSNARHGGGTVIPHLNFSIPCAALEPIFKFSKDMQDLSILQCLDEPNEHLSSIWALMPPLSPRPVPVLTFLDVPESLSEINTKNGKGSRFAKFITEKHGEVFPRPNQLVKVEKPSDEIIRSKL